MGRMNAGFRIPLDERACDVLRTIEATGESAWFVGGCVRDALLGRPAHDFDIATSARWPNVAALARERGWRVVDTGCAHGSIAVVADGLPVETTTYRVESGYSDARRPDSVKFVDDIASDLARRDFRMNAIAYHPERGLLDPFDGRGDIARRIVRTVGDARKRFEEDPLRIMRALRFSAQLGFAIDPATERFVFACAPHLERVAKERLFAELSKLLLSPCAGRTLARYAAVIERIVFGATHRAHAPGESGDKSPFEKTARIVDAAPVGKTVRFAALFCDFDEGEGSPGERESQAARRRADDARSCLERLKAPRALTQDAAALVAAAADPCRARREDMLLQAARYDGDVAFLRMLFALEDACEKAASGKSRDKEALFDELLARGEPMSRRDLALSGRDLVECGIAPGPAIALVLDSMLAAVIAGRIANSRDELIAAVPRFLASVDDAAASGAAEKYRKKMRQDVDEDGKAR